VSEVTAEAEAVRGVEAVFVEVEVAGAKE